MPASPAISMTDPRPGEGLVDTLAKHFKGMLALQQSHQWIVGATTRAAQWADPRSHTGRGARTQGRTWVRASVAVCEGVRAAELRP